MNHPMNRPTRHCPTSGMLTYSLGECANSLVMNGIFGFAMLFYTKSLGLDPTWAGLAMSLSVFWEAVTEPVMGHISDNTRSRWGRRHPYMLTGGLLMALCSYLIWAVPPSFRDSQMSVFWYLVAMNLLLRTGLTMFFIPYLALGFEMCGDYQGRARLQGDVDPAVAEVAGWLSPNPGGVGPMTRAMLLQNVVDAAERRPLAG